MKVEGYEGVRAQPRTSPDGVPGWHAWFETHSITYLDDQDCGDIQRPMRRAALSALQHAGLLAAVHFGADITPFVSLMQPVIDATANDDEGRVIMINRTPGEEEIVVAFNSGAKASFHPRVIGGLLKSGRWRLP